MLSTLFKNVNALSMFVIITVLGISIYTILTYKSLLLFEKDIYRIKAQISSLSIALQNQMQKECAHVEPEKQEQQEQKQQQNSFDGQGRVMQNEGVKEQMTHERPTNMMNTVDAQGNTQKEELKEELKKEEEDEEDDDVSAAEIAKLKKLVANIESDDENSHNEDSHNESEDGEISLCPENEPLELNDMVQNTKKKEEGTKEKDMQDDQDLSIESFIQGHPVGEEENASVPLVTAEQLHKMRYEELRQYLRLRFGVSQSRGTKADLIAKINQQQDAQK